MRTSSNIKHEHTQHDYTIGFKVKVVIAVEKGDMTYKQALKIYVILGRSTVLTWLRKHEEMDCSTIVRLPMPPKAKEIPAQTIRSLE